MRRDEIALSLRDGRDFFLDLIVECIELTKVLLEICLDVCFVIGEELFKLRGGFFRCLFIECDVKPEMWIDNALAVLLHVVDFAVREILRHSGALLFEHFRHLALEVQTVIEEEIRFFDLLEVGRLRHIEMRILARRDDEFDVHIVACELLRHILKERGRDGHRFLCIRRLISGAFIRRSSAASAHKGREEKTTCEKYINKTFFVLHGLHRPFFFQIIAVFF